MEQIISPADALPGRRETMVIGQQHAVNGHPTQGPWPEGMAVAWFGIVRAGAARHVTLVVDNERPAAANRIES